MLYMHNDDLHKIRHSLAHLLASVVLEQDPGAKLGVGPVVENGFYYDILTTKPISENQLPALENKIRALIKKNLPFMQENISIAQARELFASQPFKLELISDIETKGATSVDESLKQEGKNVVSIYKTGRFTDLCQGPHVKHSGEIKPDAFKLTKLAGAYWRGSEKNAMLTRVYGVAFATKKELDGHLTFEAEAQRRDHRKLGKELGLFTISPLVGAGLPLIQPKGAIVRRGIEQFLWELHKEKGHQHVWTPHIAKEDLYITSGHAEKFGDELFRVQGKEEKFIMKPMNCPHHMQIFADNQFSYRDMPVRYFEPATVYRDEKSGQLGGLTRVRSITQDDGHLFCSVDQIQKEVSTIVGIIKKFYKTFGMMDGYWVSLSVRGEDKSGYLGTEQAWTAAEHALETAAKYNKLNYKRVEGEAVFYGPKLDFMFKDAIGRPWQLATIQCDFNLPERFNLSFTNNKGEKERPVVIHRAISGSLERFMGILIEHFAGAFPLWLAPVQAWVMPIGKKHKKYAKEVYKLLAEASIRVELKDDNETIGKKIREGEKQKIPYMLIIGDKEVKSQSVAVRTKGKDKGPLKTKKLLAQMQAEIEKKK
ncbi:threonine--tRNA ligase [Candidatus Azambacteria bacterium RIFCSPHIGHO2_02_FULL_52_12]|uniref:Threonine--tRNA ligase n=1 Tax=Candidatus Azambacteria bacterium RIFCSPLOWO2_01_FULL_46_25 TaxID=1797298 RepID=A0A1F5BVF2_9BACT|nr:MAG: threonine--tRNA ligase [Candidatus Azambacteria bacterium RIFCSPHIGHO2_02_FULL_52_12]OGD34576.1 MAG: threonine--tRNA ligase [Candidatus Azambacteria bacterium RIFCSPLOWO2_01_FULL_46_25]OGD37982.1 MAG: threonine--tRNA ligase [Candidatus Azambacteria bacterium RIFCSPHIGHO2_01_FULL_51_74]